jgi:hypothetical protein
VVAIYQLTGLFTSWVAQDVHWKRFLFETPEDHNAVIIIRLLWAMPHLETLTLGSRYITDRFLNMLAATAAALIRREGQTAVPFLPKLQSLKCIGRPIFSWSWLPNVFGSCGTNESSDSASESGTSDSDTSESDTPKSGTIDRRPLRSFTVVQDVDDSDYPEADVKAELKRLREEGYVVDIVFGRVKSVLATM